MLPFPFLIQKHMTRLKPVEDFVLSGFSQRYQQVFFGCPVVIAANEVDEKQAVSRLTAANGTLQYPYAILKIQTISYEDLAPLNDNYMGRRGLMIKTNETDKLGLAVRLIPVAIEMECKFVTNSNAQLVEYSKLWMFAYRFNHLKFNLNYGNLNLECKVLCSESISMPQANSKLETVSEYQATTTATIHGYMSKEQLAKKPLLHELKESVGLGNSQGISINKVVWEIPPIRKAK